MEKQQPQNDSFFISFDGTKIFYELGGEKNKKETIVFIHGFGGNLRAWDKQVLFFQNKGYRTLTFDLRAHGLSDCPKNISDYNIDFFVKDILLFLETHPIKNFILVGHCLGGTIILKVVQQLKIKPKKVILVATSTKPFFNTIFYKYSRFFGFLIKMFFKLPINLGKTKRISFEKFSGTSDFNIKRIISDIYYTTLQPYLAVLSHMFLVNYDYLLNDISTPTLIIHGAKDKVISLSEAHHLDENIENSNLVIFPNDCHVIPFNNPNELSKQIKTFIKV
ncbi:MAG: alpha/beta hydrolase [Candidatus Pacebacteria bacterium]|jgi:pimeloyl-ACP methyl ester carboxylesterase|nr:alpha/beta hydrolase [Candidatus Paceibacterota bacterium]MBT4652584.1 alpha/beta hydrolase [Candidatus Paceibacterota bacterium]MBT6756411.1 alpha/beta hydrolase [Candidatus Paceibacterota bacterium]MBT6921295.1 alpha/beta hydrolase [Candidatus Paceibacterota bacterium]